MTLSPTPLPYNHEAWLGRVFSSWRLAFVVITCALSLGVAGYHYIGHLAWVDALLEASMILGGMGPVAQMQSDAVKIFASFYALMSGLMIISVTSIILGPWVQRMIHHPHHGQERAKK